ncbi:2,3-dihydroxybenzoate decarboxylase [Fusarium oxysporum f. sp. albedinis]|nr:2,3-dihydroxybenzoate decarboxylase [Fusarium oxysporum f. sp. albedinis]
MGIRAWRVSLVRTPTKLCARWAKAEAIISITTTDAPMAGAGGTAVEMEDRPSVEGGKIVNGRITTTSRIALRRRTAAESAAAAEKYLQLYANLGL